MKALERFYIMFCLVAIFVRLIGATDGILIQIIAFSALGSYYFLFTFFLLEEVSFGGIFQKATYHNAGWKRVLAGFLSGAIFLFSLISVLFYSIWQHAFGEQVSMCLVLLLLPMIIAIARYKKHREDFYKQLLIRAIAIAAAALASLLIMNLIPQNLRH